MVNVTAAVEHDLLDPFASARSATVSDELGAARFAAPLASLP
jgi:hypothetical protein